ncbi:helix-turn-helix domain-containing protein [Litoribacter ruber]|uniref:helix-turn-helix domain-containing protein n=1 Tax=Litoribacter ruber TaxID=702568 RepID=UPI001BDB3045|nr:helix-turn-helix domain-containing protein [Litoribacter ruber]MBT0813099.1 helix-turn-helix domain-containing protein [Litoribacter ruber]
MNSLNDIKKPSKDEQMVALESYNALASMLSQLRSDNPEIEIEETQKKIKIPMEALKLFAKVLKAMGQGKPISIVPMATELTTQAAAEFLGCSRPHFVKLLEEGKIPFTKIGKHRRVKFEDVAEYKAVQKKNQEALLQDIMKSDEDLGLYDS